MNTQYRKNLKDVATACKNYTDSQIAKAKDDLRWELGTYDLSVDSVDGSTMLLPTPSDATQMNINKVEGKSEKCSNLYDNSLIAYSNKIYDTGNATFITNANYDIFGYYDVKPNQSYTLSFYNNYDSGTTSRKILFYQDTTFLSVAEYIPNALSKGTYTFTTPLNTNKILVQIRKTDQNVMLNEGSTALPYKPYYTGIHNFAWTGITIKDSNDTTQETISVDLSTILYNGSPLFEENSLKAVGTAKDYITPYKAHKQMGYVDLGSLNWSLDAYGNWLCPNGSISGKSQLSCLCSRYPVVEHPENVDYGCRVSGSLDRIVIHDKDTLSMTSSRFKEYVSGVTFIYELATPIEVSIDWSDKLSRQTCYSNGSTTLLNTNNQDTTSQIDYLIEEVKA